jgi:hypothetical protein
VSSTPGVCVLAWSLAEGDLLPGGETVISVLREPVTGLVSVACDDGTRRRLSREDRVIVARRAVPDAVVRPGWRIGAFVAAARARRHASRASGLP